MSFYPGISYYICRLTFTAIYSYALLIVISEIQMNPKKTVLIICSLLILQLLNPCEAQWGRPRGRGRGRGGRGGFGGGRGGFGGGRGRGGGDIGRGRRRGGLLSGTGGLGTVSFSKHD